MENILSVATLSGCDAIHPGFGYLSENSTFARLVEKCGMTFIGPSGDVIDQMGNKSVARQMMIEAGVPVVPGSDGSIESVSQGKEIARKIGYPVLIKATAGGGGRGMRKCFKEEDFENAYLTAKAEAKACFGDDDMYMEKLILNPKHIEFQILADHFGNVIHLGERDCSIQRRNQKMMEESPSKALSQELREKMGNDAIKAAKKVGYVNAGTIEFVLAPDGKYYFIEMNTRIQVEHPVTEMVTGVDFVREQIRIAAHLKLNYKQSDPVKMGAVNFSVTPKGAVMSIDGVEVDYSTPVSLSYGTHRVKLVANHYQEYSEIINVNSAYVTKIIDMTSSGTSTSTAADNTSGYKVSVTAPKGAVLYVNSEYIGTVPCSFDKSSGKKTITLSQNGYNTVSYTISIANTAGDLTYAFPEMISGGTQETTTQVQVPTVTPATTKSSTK